MRALLNPDPEPLDLPEMHTLGEIIAGKKLHDGAVVNLTSQEWMDRWRRVRTSHPDFHEYQSESGSGK